MKSNMWSIIIISMLGVGIDIIMHIVFTPYSFGIDEKQLPLAFSLFSFAIFIIMTYIFFRNSYKIPYGKIPKGLRYGLLISLMWILGTLEASFILDVSLKNKIFGGLLDIIPIVIIGALLNIFTKNKINLVKENKHNIRTKELKFLIISIFTIIYVLIRYSSYILNIIPTLHANKPIITLIWTISMGIFIGIMYISLMSVKDIQRSIVECVTFGMVIFGINWMMFNLFHHITNNINLLDTLLRCGLDTAAVVLASYFAIKYDCYYIENRSMNKIKISKA